MINKDHNWYNINIGIIAIVIVLLLILFCIKIAYIPSRPSISIESNKLGGIDLKTQFARLSKCNPTLLDTDIRLLCFARAAAVRNYKLYTLPVIEKRNETIKDKGQVIVKNSGSIEFLENKPLIDFLTKFDFKNTKTEFTVKITPLEKSVILDNKFLINESIKNSNLLYDSHLSFWVKNKYYRVEDDLEMRVSPLDLMFARYLIYIFSKYKST